MLQTTLHPTQYDVATDRHRFRIICAGRRWGKSTLAQLVVLDWATRTPGTYWIVSPTYRQGKQIHWRGLQQIIPREWIAKKNEVELSITLRNGAVIELKGAENPDALRGVKLRGLVIDEIASIRNWDWLWDEVLRATLTDYEAPCLFISTPKGYNHFYELFELGQHRSQDVAASTGESNYRSWRFTSYDNPYIPKAEIDAAKEEVGHDTFVQEYLAQFTRFRGLIYTDFDANRHVHPFDHALNEYGDRYFGMDFAVRGWTAAIPALMRSDGHIYLLDTYKERNLTAQEHGPAILTMLETYASLGRYTGYGDPAGFANNQQGIRHNQPMTWSLADEYHDQGFPMVPANNEVAAGINYVKQLFRQDKLHIHPRCTDLIDELTSYQWKEQPSTQIGVREEPEEVRKINDHLVDAMRYLLYSKPTAPEEDTSRIKPGMPITFTMKLDEPDDSADEYTPMEIPDIYD